MIVSVIAGCDVVGADAGGVTGGCMGISLGFCNISNLQQKSLAGNLNALMEGMRMSFFTNIKRKLPLNVLRVFINCWPPLLGAGIKIANISPDARSVTVMLKLRWYNTNYVGTHFGGSIFAMTDPFYMLMLIHNLGNGYYVWDKAASIDYLKPGRSTLTAHFNLTQDILDTVLEKTKDGEKYIFDLPVEILDADGVVIAKAIRTLYVRKKPPQTSSIKNA